MRMGSHCFNGGSLTIGVYPAVNELRNPSTEDGFNDSARRMENHLKLSRRIPSDGRIAIRMNKLHYH